MQYTVLISGKPKKNLQKIPQPWQSRIIHALEQLESDPFCGEKMWGKYKDFKKLRIWPYRVVYQLDERRKIVSVVEIGHRGGMGYK